MTLTAYTGCDVHDGTHAAQSCGAADGGRRLRRDPACRAARGADIVTLPGGTLCPGFVDLQVNGGGGVMFNDARDRRHVAHHGRVRIARLGTMALLPTLITDRRDVSRAAIAAAVSAVGAVPGIIGLHLEGPHLSLARKGAHDPALIRPLDGDDMAMLCEAAAQLPNLMLTVAAETVTPAQIAQLTPPG